MFLMACCCGPPVCTGTTATFNVAGCFAAALAGATVTISGGISGTTNGSGQYIPTITADGVYDYSVSMAGYTTATGTFTITNCTSTTVYVGLSPDISHVCCSACTGFIMPNVLYWTDDNGTFTLSNTGGCTFTGTGTVNKLAASITGPFTCTNFGFQPCTFGVTAGSTISVEYTIDLVYSTGNWYGTVSAAYIWSNSGTSCTLVAAFHCPGPPSIGSPYGGPTAPSCTGSGVRPSYTLTGGGTQLLTGSCSESSVSLSGSAAAITYVSIPSDGTFLPLGSPITVTN